MENRVVCSERKHGRDDGATTGGATSRAWVARLARTAWPATALACGAFGLLAYASMMLTRFPEGITAIWLPNAVATALLLRCSPAREWHVLGALATGAFLAALALGDTPQDALELSIAQLVEVWVAVQLTRRWCGPAPQMDTIRDLGGFALAAGVCAPVASAMVEAMGQSLHSTGGISAAWLVESAFSASLDMLVLAPATMVLIDALRFARCPTRRELNEWLVLGIGGTALTLAVFSQTTYPLLYLIPPIVVAHAFRLGALGTTFSIFKIAAIALVMTSFGYGPIKLIHYPHLTEILLLESFLASAMAVGLPVAAMLAARERMMAELAAGRQELALLAENITDAILRFDMAGVCIFASPSTRDVLGIAPASLVGSDFYRRVHPQSRAAIFATAIRLRNGQSDQERVTYRRQHDDANGLSVHIEADCALARNPRTGLPDGIIVSARDVSRRVDLENELKRARDHAEAAARAKAQFLANMSHEIRTPMNGVLGFSELLRGLPLPPEAARYAELIDRSGRSMMLLLNDILDISKIESGQLIIQREPLDIHQLIEDCVQLHLARAAQNGITLSLRCEADVPRWVITDPLRLRQILLNLIGNAVKFTEVGIVAVAVTREGARLAITVADTGIGIRADRLTSIFDPFVQEEASTTRRFGGTGLGLSISRQLAGLLGGGLSVESTPGTGSCFALRIPLERVEEPAIPQRRASDPCAAQALQPSRILLADDNDINRILVTAMLENLGQEVSLAHDGTEAIEAVLVAEECGTPFDLVLMDIQMPGCDGYSAARAIRTLGIGAHQIPIIALTANAYPEDVAAARDAGMQAHLAKPLVLETLAGALARWLPVRIVEDRRSQVPLPGRPVSSQPSELVARWAERRREAIAAVSDAVRTGAFDGASLDDLAQTVHKLAGTAGMFGDEELGRRAALLERALKGGVGPLGRTGSRS